MVSSSSSVIVCGADSMPSASLSLSIKWGQALTSPLCRPTVKMKQGFYQEHHWTQIYCYDTNIRDYVSSFVSVNEFHMYPRSENKELLCSWRRPATNGTDEKRRGKCACPVALGRVSSPIQRSTSEEGWGSHLASSTTGTECPHSPASHSVARSPTHWRPGRSSATGHPVSKAGATSQFPEAGPLGWQPSVVISNRLCIPVVGVWAATAAVSPPLL